jgi:lysophospholipase L1-like esterase
VRILNHPLAARDVEIRVSAQGFRHRELGERRPGELRIIALGDSTTAGDYLPFEELYTTRLAQLLADSLGGRPVEVVNAGVGNVGTQEELSLLEDRGLALRPDVVLLGVSLNDPLGTWSGADVPAPDELSRYSALAQALAILRLRMRLAAHPLVTWNDELERLPWRSDPEAFRELAHAARLDWGVAWREPAWAGVDRELERLRALADAHGFGVALVVFPVAYQVEAEFAPRAPQERLERRARELGFAYLDLLPALRRHSSESVFLDHAHLDARGHALVAEALARFLRGEVLR